MRKCIKRRKSSESMSKNVKAEDSVLKQSVTVR